MPKEARKKKEKKLPYFGEVEEDAVKRYLNSTSDRERNIIYNKYLKNPLNKMVESIIRTYGLQRKLETFDDLHADTLSFLMTKADKFNVDAGKKAYSYYGTICKRYLIGMMQTDEKRFKNLTSYDTMSQESEPIQKLTYNVDYEEQDAETLITQIVDTIKKELDSESNVGKKALNEIEKKVGNALVDILSTHTNNFDVGDGGAKFNRSSMLETMRNYTNLSTKEIRIGMKRYKLIYESLKKME